MDCYVRQATNNSTQRRKSLILELAGQALYIFHACLDCSPKCSEQHTSGDPKTHTLNFELSSQHLWMPGSLSARLVRGAGNLRQNPWWMLPFICMCAPVCKLLVAESGRTLKLLHAAGHNGGTNQITSLLVLGCPGALFTAPRRRNFPIACKSM